MRPVPKMKKRPSLSGGSLPGASLAVAWPGSTRLGPLQASFQPLEEVAAPLRWRPIVTGAHVELSPLVRSLLFHLHLVEREAGLAKPGQVWCTAAPHTAVLLSAPQMACDHQGMQAAALRPPKSTTGAVRTWPPRGGTIIVRSA